MKFNRLIPTLITMAILSACSNPTDSSVPLTTYVETTLSSHSGVISETTPATNVLSDGIYFAQSDDYSEYTGYQEYVSIEVIDSEIKNITLDAVRDSVQNNLSEDLTSDVNTDVLPVAEQLKLLENHLLTAPDYLITSIPEEMLNSMTIHVSTYLNLVEQALTLEPITIGTYQDGFYYATTDHTESPAHATIFLSVLHGNIMAVNFNIFFEDALVNLKADNASTDPDISLLYKQVVELEKHLISIQNPMLITYNEDNTTDILDEPFLYIHDFVNLASDALAAGPLIK